MCKHPAILAPCRGFEAANSLLIDIKPGISASAKEISFLPQFEREISFTL